VTIPNGFTVAQDGTGQFKTINDALANVDRPGMTIQVLDDATYREFIHIGNNASHEGLKLQAARRATIALLPENKYGVIFDVPRVELRGLRFRMDRADTIGVVVNGVTPRVLLEDLDIVYESTEPTARITSHSAVNFTAGTHFCYPTTNPPVSTVQLNCARSFSVRSAAAPLPAPPGERQHEMIASHPGP
jgi:hypothetical protein